MIRIDEKRRSDQIIGTNMMAKMSVKHIKEEMKVLVVLGSDMGQAM